MSVASDGPRVALVGPWPPPYGGVQTHLVALRDGLRTAGATVGVFNITRHRGTPGDGIYFPIGPLELLWQMMAFRPDVVHVHLGGDMTTRLIALLTACRLVFGRVVATVHSGGYPTSARAKNLTSSSPVGFVFRSLAHVIVVNAELKRLFESIGVQPERITELVPTLGIPAAATTLPVDLAAFIGAADPLIVTVGLLEDEYLLPLQLDAFDRLTLAFPMARFVIVGSGSREMALRARLDGMAASRQVMLYGDMPHPVTIALLQKASLLWRITAYDGDSVSVREAIALETPVLATDNGMRPVEVQLTESNAEAIAAKSTAILLGAIADRSAPRAIEARPAAVLVEHVEIVLTSASIARAWRMAAQ